MNTLAPPLRIANTAAVLDGPYGAVTRQAARCGTSRQALYRDAPRVLQALDGSHLRQQLHNLQNDNDRLHAECDRLHRQLRQAVVLDADRLACFAATAQAEGVSLAALPLLDDPVWTKTRRALTRLQLLTFLDRTQQQLAALLLSAAVREAAVQAEGLPQRPEGLRGDRPSAAALGGIVLATALVLSLSGPVAVEAVAQVRQVLRQAWRSSSLVECLNSVARMQQSRHRRMTQGLLSLKRLYWNCRTFSTGRRRKQTPYGLLGMQLPTTDWWELLRLSPEQLRQQLSAPGVAA
jgi:hypothetical protein